MTLATVIAGQSVAGGLATLLGDSFELALVTTAVDDQALAAPLTATVTIGIGGDDGANSYKLPKVGEAGKVPIIFRNQSIAMADLSVYPSIGEEIDELGANEPLVIADGVVKKFYPLTPTKWISI